LVFDEGFAIALLIFRYLVQMKMFAF